MKAALLAVCGLSVLAALAPAATAAKPPATMPVIHGNGKSGPPTDDYKLIWSDEFDGKQLDLTQWDYRQLGKRNDAVNAKDAVELDGQGHLILWCRPADDAVHCGMISTEQSHAWTYGYFECSAQMMQNTGNWGAFWMQSKEMPIVGNPLKNGVELDIFEYFKHHGDGVIDHAILWNGYKKGGGSTGQIKRLVPEVDTGFHTFGLQWTPTEYVFFIDGVESWRTEKHQTTHGEYIILSNEMLKSYGYDPKRGPDKLVIDYVRVYQRPGEVPPATQPTSAPSARSSGRMSG